MKHLYELHKAFAFRTLWEGNNPLASFRRLATESARGTGRLNGAVQLTGELRKINRIKNKAIRCFTDVKYTTDSQKWSFDNVKDKVVSYIKCLGKAVFKLFFVCKDVDEEGLITHVESVRIQLKTLFVFKGNQAFKRNK